MLFGAVGPVGDECGRELNLRKEGRGFVVTLTADFLISDTGLTATAAAGGAGTTTLSCRSPKIGRDLLTAVGMREGPALGTGDFATRRDKSVRLAEGS